jgi:glycosyltransferase involved in cell wall biosynthesis
MRIAVDASRVCVAQRTGTERYSLELIRSLLRVDSDNEYLLYFNRPPDEAVIPPGPNWRPRVAPLPRLWTHLRLSRELGRDRPDLLFVPAHVLPLRHPARSVVTVHDLGFHFYAWAHPILSRLYLELSTRWAARRATRLIAISRSTALDLARVYKLPPERVRVIYEGVSDSFRPVREARLLADLRSRYALGPRPYLLALGTIQPRKNLKGLLRAYRILLDTTQDQVQLVLAGRPASGQGAIQTELRRLALEPHVRRLGYVPDEDLPALLSGALVYVQPSFYEGFGLSVLEAMACGTAVVASDASSLPEVVGGAGVLVDPHSPREMASALQDLISKPAMRAELAAAGRRRAGEFTWERCARETLEVLLEAGRV